MAMSKLSDQEMSQVVGGFQEKNKDLPTYGMEIQCPSCHETAASSFADNVLYNPAVGSVEYQCTCGCRFVCYGNQVFLKDDWQALCKSKGINDVFA